MHTVFDRDWFIEHQSILLKIINHPLGRAFFHINRYSSDVGNRQIVVILPDSISWEAGNGQLSTEFRTYEKYKYHIAYQLKFFWWLFHFWDMGIANKIAPILNFGFDTTGDLFPAAGSSAPMDGYVQRDLGAGTPETFSTLRTSAGNGSNASSGADRCAGLDGSATTDQYKRMNRAIFGFNTGAAIGDSDTVTAATFSLSPTTKSNGLGSDDIHCCLATPASSSAIANSDYGNLGTTSFGSIAYASWTADGGYDDFTFNASGIAAISTTTYTFLGTRLNWDINNTTTGLTWASGAATRYECIYADFTGTSRDPKLVVTYTPAAGGGIVGKLYSLQQAVNRAATY